MTVSGVDRQKKVELEMNIFVVGPVDMQCMYGCQGQSKGGGAGPPPGTLRYYLNHLKCAGKLGFYVHSKIFASPVLDHNTLRNISVKGRSTVTSLPRVLAYLGLALTRVSALFLTRRRELREV
jgi:hypothetical protein